MKENKTILVTGGAGFIGSALIRHLINETNHTVINVDKLTYAGNLSTLDSISENKRYFFEKVDICNAKEINRIFNQYRPDILMNLAAETHVDRSIDSPSEFISTNIIGTYTLLEQSLGYLKTHKNFRFHHVSTDEVYGDLGYTNNLFTEKSPYNPSSPYSASKASSDHLVKAWHRTYDLPIVITNCSNNYGPYHFPEKLIPLTILNAINGNNINVYGDGKQIRDWLYVEDHAKALILVATEGKIGETYNIGGNNEKKNIEVVSKICNILDSLNKSDKYVSYSDLITFVKDRPGHDVRYAIDNTKIRKDLGWQPLETFDTGLKKTVEWYMNNLDWCDNIIKRSYKGQRLGFRK